MLNALLGLAVALLLAQGQSPEGPFVAPDVGAPGVDYCSEMWHALTGACSPCHSLASVLQPLLRDIPLVCPD